jgi:hypothetical protein
MFFQPPARHTQARSGRQVHKVERFFVFRQERCGSQKASRLTATTLLVPSETANFLKAALSLLSKKCFLGELGVLSDQRERAVHNSFDHFPDSVRLNRMNHCLHPIL